MNDTPRGIRNNNPGNVRRSRQHWQGEVDAIDGVRDADFVQCASPVYGIRIPAVILLHYLAAGFKTPRTIVSRWAPSVENDTEAYIADFAKRLGVFEDSPVDLHQHDLMAEALKALIHHENGQQPYTDFQIQQAMLLAGVHL